tara:strand:- start:8437 stop:8673 length:237 start_codon:yes stop_codon:yes gene_type:complete
MTMWLVHHNCERSRQIKTIHVGVFHSKEDAEQFVKDMTTGTHHLPNVSAYGLGIGEGRRYKIEEIPVITKKLIGDEEE